MLGVGEEGVRDALAVVDHEVPAQVPRSTAPGPREPVVQSTTPVSSAPSQSVLPGWKSRWMKRSGRSGGGSWATAIASSHTPRSPPSRDRQRSGS